MVLVKMVPQKNGSGKNGPRKICPRKNGPRKIGPGKNGPRKIAIFAIHTFLRFFFNIIQHYMN